MANFKFIEEISRQMRDEIANAIEGGRSIVYYDYETPSGDIHIEAGSNCETTVDVFHDGGPDRNSDNIARVVLDVLPDWSDIEKEMEEERRDTVWQRNGFSDATDYYSYRY